MAGQRTGRLLRVPCAALRLLLATVHGLRALWIIRRRFPHWNAAERDAAIERWTHTMLGILNIEFAAEGAPRASGPLLVVANHVSWLDVLVVQASHRPAFVAKAEISRWPLIGAVAAGLGTLFIARAVRRDAVRTVQRMAEGLRAGTAIAVFPEGTTSDGRTVLPFHGNLLQAAIDTGAPVQPVAIRFLDAASGQPTHAADYVGDDSMMGSVWRTLTAPPIRVLVRFGTPQRAQGRDRRAWAQALQADVAALLQATSATP